jgi:actin-like ATPase involved in cell morphogenesis
MQERHNYYILLELAPSVDNLSEIESQILIKKEEWSTQKLRGTPAARRKAEHYLSWIRDIETTLKDPELRRKEARDAETIIKQERSAKLTELDVEISLLKSSGRYTPQQIQVIAKRLGGSFSEKEIEEHLRKAGVPTAASEHIYGIDLGTAYCSIAYVDEHGKPVIVPNLYNGMRTPSVVYFEAPDNVVVGQDAKDVIALYSSRCVSTVKRSMGDPNWEFACDGNVYKPQEISSYILRKLVQDAEAVTGDTIKDVVITCPAYFGLNQKEATKQAGIIAGLNVLYVIPEPTAAAIAYGIEQEDDQVVLIYDLGGETFDITLAEVKQGAITIISTGGDDRLGGKDWDDAIISYLALCFETETNILAADLIEGEETYQDLLVSAEKCKKSLTSRKSVQERVVYGSDRVAIELTREKFEEITSAYLQRTIQLTEEMIARAKENGYERIDKLLLIGGSAYMPQVLNAIKLVFPSEIRLFDPDLTITKGAAIFGYKYKLYRETVPIIGAERWAGTTPSLDELERISLCEPSWRRVLDVKCPNNIETETSLPTTSSRGIAEKEEVEPQQLVGNFLMHTRFQRPNYFLLLNLSPSVEDWPVIEGQILKKKRKWSKDRAMGNPAIRRKAEQYLSLVKDIEEGLKNPEWRRKEARDAERLIEEERSVRLKELDEIVQVLEAIGYCRPENIVEIHKQLEQVVSKTEIEDRIRKAGVLLAQDSWSADGQKAKEFIDPVTAASIKRNLDHLNIASLYAFLDRSPQASPKSLYERAHEINKEILNIGKTDANASASKELCGICLHLFRDEKEKERYDNTLAVEAMNQLAAQIEIAGQDKFISLAEMNVLVQQAKDRGVDTNDARAYIEAYARKRKWLIQRSLRHLRAFLCHSSGDKQAVRELYHRLRRDGFSPWLDEVDLLPGQKWEREIRKAVRNSDVVIVCLSQSSINKRGYVQKEITYALDVAQEHPDDTIFIIPLKLEECNVPDRLCSYHWVDFFDSEGYKKLMSALNLLMDKLV